MVLPQPWCTKDPRPCIKVVGLTEIFIAVISAIMLVTLPFIMMDLEHEIDYIKKHHHGMKLLSTSAITPGQVFYTLNVTTVSRYDCNELVAGTRNFLDEYLKGKIYYTIVINQTEVLVEEAGENMSRRIFCEIHVRTKRNPTKKVVQVRNVFYSILNIVAECISQYTGEEKSEVEDKMTVIVPSSDQIAEQLIYSRPIGTDPERMFCIEEQVRVLDKQEALDVERLMYHLLATSTLFSMVTGFLLTTAGYIVSRILLLLAFFMACLSIGFMAGGIVLINDPNLCLFQYGGISVESVDTPTYMQTIITYICSIYIAAVKFYCLWFILSYGEIVPKLKEISEFKSPPAHSDYVAEVAREVDEKNHEHGGTWSVPYEHITDEGDLSESDKINMNQKSYTKDFAAVFKSTSHRLAGEYVEENKAGKSTVSNIPPRENDDHADNGSKLRLRDISKERGPHSKGAILKEHKTMQPSGSLKKLKKDKQGGRTWN